MLLVFLAPHVTTSRPTKRIQLFPPEFFSECMLKDFKGNSSILVLDFYIMDINNGGMGRSRYLDFCSQYGSSWKILDPTFPIMQVDNAFQTPCPEFAMKACYVATFSWIWEASKRQYTNIFSGWVVPEGFWWSAPLNLNHVTKTKMCIVYMVKILCGEVWTHDPSVSLNSWLWPQHFPMFAKQHSTCLTSHVIGLKDFEGN